MSFRWSSVGMTMLSGNKGLRDAGGKSLSSLFDINLLDDCEKERIYASLLPPRLFEICGIDAGALCGPDRDRRVEFIAPPGLGLLRVVVRDHLSAPDPVFFLELADTSYGQMELAFCIIADPAAPRFAVDRDLCGRDTCFATMGRNIPEEVRAMAAGLFPNQTRRGLGLFATFFPRLERFTDSLGMKMIVAEPLNYGNAIRYEKYGFDYLMGRRLMKEINEGFAPGGELFRRLDGSSPFRMPGMERTVRGRCWAIHDGVLDEAWDEVRIYKTIGQHAGVDTFPDREHEEEDPSKRSRR
jgi:hypothetical protein